MRFSVLILAAALVATACGSGDRPATASSASSMGGTIIIPILGDARDIFPVYVSEMNGRRVQDLVFDHLAEIDPSLTTIGDKTFSPRLAEKWAWTPDSLSIAFSINPKARWHDGKPVTANDVRYSFEAFTDSKAASPVASLLGNVDSVSVRDSLTAVVWFKKHTPEQFYDVAYQLIIMPKHVYGAIPVEQLRTSDKTHTIVGSGRFRVVRWEPGTRIELVADTANYRGRAKLDRVIFVPTDAAAAAAQILTGQADVMEAFPNDQLSQLDSSKVARPYTVPQLGYMTMGMNRFVRKSKTVPHPIFSDARVRRALSMAVDREAMLQNVFGKNGHLSHGPFAMAASFADSAISPPRFDTTAAKALLDSAGWPVGANGIRAKNGRPLTFSLGTTSSAFRRRYSVLLQDQLAKIGVHVDIEPINDATAYDVISSGDFDAVLWGFSPDPGPSGFIQTWGTAGIGQGQNYLRYSSKKVDALIDSATSSFDRAKSKTYMSKAIQAIMDDVPAIWLYDISFTNAINRRIDVAPFRADGWWVNLADWSIPADKRIDRDRIGLDAPKP